MSELVRIGCIFYEDLATEPGTGSMLIRDRSLSEDEFAARHAKTIQQRYVAGMHLDLSLEEATFFASCTWHYLNMPQSGAMQAVTVSPCCWLRGRLESPPNL